MLQLIMTNDQEVIDPSQYRISYGYNYQNKKHPSVTRSVLFWLTIDNNPNFYKVKPYWIREAVKI